MTSTIDAHGDPLAFEVRRATGRSPLLGGAGGADVFKVEARQMTHHQKEAVVTQGAGGGAWRVSSDEGAHLRGTDLAPFPLGFFNAGLQADLYRRLRGLAAARGLALDAVEIHVVNHYWLTGSFVHGTGEGHAEPSEIEVRLQSRAARQDVVALVRAAVEASPAMALLRTALTGNTFALYINGRRRQVDGVAGSPASDAPDPYRVYASAPRPLEGDGARTNLIEKTGQQEPGAVQLATPGTTTRVVRNVFGTGKSAGAAGLYEVDTWLGLPGASHFRFCTDEGAQDVAPSGLALLAAGVAFCYMTQLSRYIENMKLPIGGVRLVQFNPFDASEDKAAAGPIDTHLFLNGAAPDEIHAKLLGIAARTCYLHATAAAALNPIVRVVHNGVAVDQPGEPTPQGRSPSADAGSAAVADPHSW